MSSWSVSVRSYDGPLDLLYYIIKDKNLDIRTVGIAEIADQYEAYVEELRREEIDLNEASEYLDMMTSLMLLKAAELKPREGMTREELFQFEEDKELFFQELRAYEAYKNTAFGLRDLESAERDSFGRGARERFGSDSDEGIVGKEAGIYQLYEAFYKEMRASSASFGDPVHTIALDYFPLEDAKQQVGNFLRRRGRSTFDELIGADPQPLVATTTFQALLEMVKTEEVVLRQIDLGGLLWTYRRRDNDEYSEEMASTAMVEPPDYDAPLTGGLVEYIRQHVAEMGNKLGIDGLLTELTARISAGGNVTDADLDYLLAGGNLATLPSDSEPAPEATMTDEERLRAALDDEIASEMNDGAPSGNSESAGEGETGKPAEGNAEEPSGEESGEDDFDEDGFDDEEESGEEPDSEDEEPGEDFSGMFD